MKVLRALGDEDACRLLGALGVSKTVADLTAEMDIPQSTTYRKIAMLKDLGLVEKQNPSASRNVATRYHRSFREIRVCWQPDIRVDFR